MLKETSGEDLLLFIGAIAFVFFIGRFVILWYYKIDERLEELKKTNLLLQKLVDNSTPVQNPNTERAAGINEVPLSVPETDVNNPDSFNDAVNKYDNKQ